MSLPSFRPGEPFGSTKHTQMFDRPNAQSRLAASAESQYGGAVPSPSASMPANFLAIFELTDAMVHPAIDPNGMSADDPTPHAPARQVWTILEAGSQCSGSAVREYRANRSEAARDIWFPLAPRNAAGYAIGLPQAQPGDRVLCLFNPQSGRWEVVQGPPYPVTCCGILREPITSGGSAPVALWWNDADSGMRVDANDWLLPSGAIKLADTRVMVQFLPHVGQWWIFAYASQ